LTLSLRYAILDTVKQGARMNDNVTWAWYHDGGNPLVGEYREEDGTTRVLELDKDFTLGESLDMINDFIEEANRVAYINNMKG
jgi:hypothetical protein